MENRFNDSTKRAKLARRIAPALALSLGLSLFAPVFGQQAPQVHVSEKTSEATDPTQAPAPSEISRAFVEAAKRCKPSVVYIAGATTRARGCGSSLSPAGCLLKTTHGRSAANELSVKPA